MTSNAVTAALALVLTGCATNPDLPDFLYVSDFTRPPFEARLRFESQAPLIIVGRVLASHTVGRPKVSSERKDIMLQLTKIRLAVEMVIKGPITGGRLDFYYYTLSIENSKSLPIYLPLRMLYLPIEGQRRVFFLQPCIGGYRSVGDVADCTLRVRSGYHPQGFCKGKTPGCCIADVLLSPGTGYNSEDFAILLGTDLSASRATPRFRSDVLQGSGWAQRNPVSYLRNPGGKPSVPTLMRQLPRS